MVAAEILHQVGLTILPLSHLLGLPGPDHQVVVGLLLPRLRPLQHLQRHPHLLQPEQFVELHVSQPWGGGSLDFVGWPQVERLCDSSRFHLC